VHLSTNINEAYDVGHRKSKNPTILVIRSLKANSKGINFFNNDGEIWLVKRIPAQHISNKTINLI